MKVTTTILNKSNTSFENKKNFEKNKKISNILFYSLVVVIVLLLYLNSFTYQTFNKKFYLNEYDKYDLYSELNKTQVGDFTIDLFVYLTNNDEYLNNSLLNIKEISHLKDVKSLFKKIIYLKYFILFLFIVLLFLFFKQYHNQFISLIRMFLYSSSIIIFITLVLWLFLHYFQNNFYNLFFNAHKLFFTNNNWLLNSTTDNLVVIFPTQFFYDFFYNIIRQTFINSMLFLFFILNYYLGKFFINRNKQIIIKKAERKIALKNKEQNEK